MPTRRTILKGASGLLAAGAFGMQPGLSLAAAPFQKSAAPGFYRLMLGEFEVTAISDGTIPLPLETLYTNVAEDHAVDALAAAFQTSPVQTSVNAFLINTGDRLVLIDAGSGAYLGPAVGKLIKNIEAAGYHPDHIDDVVLTHIHTDHSGGLIDGKTRAFANATVRVNKREANFWLDPSGPAKAPGVPAEHFAQAKECLTPYIDAGKFATFGDNADVLPHIGSLLRPGHTPGHSSLVIQSGGRKLVVWGDITHGDVLQFDEPGVAIEFDVDQVSAIETRALAFREAVEEGYLVAGAHIAFPGIGHVRADATNFDWVPLNYSAAL